MPIINFTFTSAQIISNLQNFSNFPWFSTKHVGLSSGGTGKFATSECFVHKCVAVPPVFVVLYSSVQPSDRFQNITVILVG